MDRTVLTGSSGPTPVLTVHGINKKSSSLDLKNRFSSRFSVFTVRPPGPVRFWKQCPKSLPSHSHHQIFQRTQFSIDPTDILIFINSNDLIFFKSFRSLLQITSLNILTRFTRWYNGTDSLIVYVTLFYQILTQVLSFDLSWNFSELKITLKFMDKTRIWTFQIEGGNKENKFNVNPN